MSAALRCTCRRCAGGIIYTRATDFIDAHQLHPGEFVLDREVTILQRRGQIGLVPPPAVSLFSTDP